jgi:UMF1 family MFS transporter
LLSLVGKDMWIYALILFIVADIGFSGANLFYDSLLPDVAAPEKYDLVSSLGYAFGYCGCAVLFIINMAMVLNPSFFGFGDRGVATKMTFVSVAVWWVVFSIPLFLFVKQSGGVQAAHSGTVIKQSLKQLRKTFVEIRTRRSLWLFLLAYWLYIDGVFTFIKAAADLGLSIGLEQNGLMASLLLVQLIAFPSAYVFGRAAQRWGAVRCLFAGIGIYVFVALVGPVTVRTQAQYRFFAALSAVPLGALQALSRSYFARLIPENRSAEYFGFYNLLGKFAAVLGPAMVALVAGTLYHYGASSALSARWGCTSISLFFLVGGFLLAMAVRAAKKENVVT